MDGRKNDKITTTHNRRLAKKKRVQCLSEAFCFVSSSVLTDSEVLRNRHLRVAAKRYAPLTTPDKYTHKKILFN